MTSSFLLFKLQPAAAVAPPAPYTKSPTVQYGTPGQVRQRRHVTMTSAKISSGKYERQLASPSSLVGMLIIVVIIYSRRPPRQPRNKFWDAKWPATGLRQPGVCLRDDTNNTGRSLGRIWFPKDHPPNPPTTTHLERWRETLSLSHSIRRRKISLKV